MENNGKKYIRTKDTIFEVVEETPIIYRVKAKGNPHNIYSKSKCQTEVIKEAGTIEELCDEFVWVSVNEEYANRKANEYGLRTSKMQLGCPQLKTIYGAIWTNKGLIYVAKMNEKGELELL